MNVTWNVLFVEIDDLRGFVALALSVIFDLLNIQSRSSWRSLLAYRDLWALPKSREIQSFGLQSNGNELFRQNDFNLNAIFSI